jgi:hypothetical protein
MVKNKTMSCEWHDTEEKKKTWEGTEDDDFVE